MLSVVISILLSENDGCILLNIDWKSWETKVDWAFSRQVSPHAVARTSKNCIIGMLSIFAHLI